MEGSAGPPAKAVAAQLQGTGKAWGSPGAAVPALPLPQSCLHLWDAFPPPLPHSRGAGRWLLPPSCTGALRDLPPCPFSVPTHGRGEMIQPPCNVTFQLTLLSLQNTVTIDLFAPLWSYVLTWVSLCLAFIADTLFLPSFFRKFLSKLHLFCKCDAKAKTQQVYVFLGVYMRGSSRL